jgi:phospholipid-binding lipoprotein MlaA
VRSISDARLVLILFALLGFAIGGCSTLSPSLVIESSQLPAPHPPLETEIAELPESTNTTELVTAPVVITYEAITAENAPDWVVALSEREDAALQGPPGSPPPEPEVEEYDPWEPFNETMFSFNYHLDKWVVKPTAKAYNAAVPDMFQTMIDNAFTNLRMPIRFVNKVLQWKILDAAKEMGRFLINSTLGIGGLFDVARQEMGLEEQKADFGQTLGIWGVGPGPYLVLPLLPPLTVRDAIGFFVDGSTSPLSYYIPFWPDKFGMGALDAINDRSLNLDLFQGIEEATVDLYSSVRNGYLQRRDRMIKEGK